MGSYVEGDTPKKDGLLSTPIATNRRLSPGIMSKDGGGSNNLIPSASFGDTSAYASSINGESSNTLIGAGGVLMPRNSILMNPSNKKTFVDAWRLNDGSGPAVLHIPAPQTAKDRELEREREKVEREKEIERELKEMEQAEKVWGIPKKAFYMGLGDINFNAQMAMLGGWGNGSGPATDFRPNMIAPLPRRLSGGSPKKSSKGSKSSKKVKSKQSKGKEMERRKQQAVAAATTAANEREEEAKRKSQQNEKPKEEQEDSDESMDPEELAALNAIINTRRSMEAAQALASRNSRLSQIKKSSSSQVNLTGGDHLEKGQQEESWQAKKNDSTRSMTPSIRSLKNEETTLGSNSPLSFANRHGADLQKRQDSHIRFAPLPQAYGAPSPALNDMEGGNPFDEVRMSGEFGSQDKSLNRTATASDISGDEDSDEEEESWSRRLSGIGGGSSSSSSRNRWYLMGMPKSVFKSQGNSGSRTRRLSSASGVDASASGESLSRSPGSEQILSNGAAGTPPASAEQRRGRRTKLRRASAAISPKSRSSSVGSVDDEDRKRRRELIRASRPGGTGMVTLPDGTRIKARRVGEDNSDDEDFNEWGFAGLSRRSMGDGERPSVEAITGEKRASDDEQVGDEGEDSGSGMSWVKRRRREREQKELSLKSQEDNERIPGEATEDKVEKVLPMTNEERKEAGSPTKKNADMPARPPINPLAPTPTLSASRAAEVRRRHEQEVAAMETEVLESIAKAKKAKLQQQKDQQTHPHPHPPARSMTLDPSMAKAAEKIEITAPASPTLGNGKTHRGRPSRTTSLDEFGSHDPALNFKTNQNYQQLTSKRSASQTAAAGLSPNQLSHGRHLQSLSQTAGESSDGTKTPTGMQTPTPTPTPTPTRRRYQSPRRLTSSPPPVVLEVPDVADGRDTADTIAAGEESNREAEGSSKKLPARSSIEGRPSISSLSHDSHLGLSQSPGRDSVASLRTRNSKGRLRNSTFPIPSPDLPRRPDARGYSVVPLPIHQLGRRPERPTEGRVWQFDDLDDSSEGDDDEVDQDGETSSGEEEDEEQEEAEDKKKRNDKKDSADQEKDEEEEESTMNAEELAEEERRTAIQKQRATTRAAGAELVSSMAKARAAKKGGGSTAVGPFEKTKSNRREEKISTSPAGRRASSTGINRRESANKNKQGSPRVRSTMSSSALATAIRGGGKRRSSRPGDDDIFGLDDEDDVANGGDDDDDDDDDDDEEDNNDGLDDDEDALSDGSDDADLWPPTLSTTQLSRTLSTGDISSHTDRARRESMPTTMNRPSGSSHGGKVSKQSILLAAHSAKAKLSREKKSKEAKEKERLRILHLKENDEYLDYGWPRSLQGSSLYD